MLPITDQTSLEIKRALPRTLVLDTLYATPLHSFLERSILHFQILCNLLPKLKHFSV